MADQVEIMNLALGLLGADARITDPLEGSEVARVMSARFPTARDAAIRAHPWRFSLARARLAADIVPPAFGFGYRYLLPADPYCLVVWWNATEDTRPHVEGRYLLSDSAGPLDIVYGRRVDNPAEFDALFVEALAAKLAEQSALRLTREESVRAAMSREFDRALMDARGINARESGAPPAPVSSFLLARR